MIWQILKKTGLTLLRNPFQLLLLVGLPLILILILGAALGGVMSGETSSIHAKVAIVENGNEQKQVDQFLKDLENSDIPKNKVDVMKQAAKNIVPIKQIKAIFRSKGMQNIVTLKTADPSTLKTVLQDESYAAVIEVPENFTYHMLQALLLEKQFTPSLKIYENGEKNIGASVVKSVLQRFQENLTLVHFAQEKGIAMDAIQVDTDKIKGNVMSVEQYEPVSAKDYYAIGMAVMNVLFIATTIGSYAFRERKMHVFNRIILADVSRWVYFSGILLAGAIFAFLHLVVVFGAAWLLFGVSWPDPAGFLIVSLGMALSVGGLSVLLVAISYRFNSEMIINFFSSFIITIFAFLGGSFFPIGQYAEIINKIGNITPNGAGMTAYLNVIRGGGIASSWEQIIFLGIFAAALVCIAAFSFPKRGLTI
ncbi:ABC transporter permease [Virgibacillus siamensis]|uniref:ABC transporter permease n=1 Tax=Virgibacillus siamensis TaxID=480071 RepID=UPI00158B9AEF|nr:ABC transporter permease [Virgibacillus siamensis]